MSRIEKLTPEQEGRLSEFRERWLQIGLSTETTDRAKSEAAVKDAYRAGGLEPPSIFIWLRSPFEGAIGAHLLSQVKSGLWGAQVWAQVGDQVWDQVLDQVGDQVGAQVWAQVRNQVRNQVWAQVWAQVRAQVWAQVWDQVLDQVGNQVWDQVGAQAGDLVWDQAGALVKAQVKAQVGDQVGAQVWRSGYGSHDAGWLSFYSFFQSAGLSCCDRLAPLMELASHCGWWWPFQGAVILTEKPTQIHRDGRNRLHNTSGPALGYSDGWGVYAVHGVRVPRDIIESGELLTITRISSEKNSEVRRVMIDLYQADKYVRDSGSKLIHEGRDGRRLWSRSVPDDESIVMVEVTNSTKEPDGTFKKYMLRVPPDTRNADEAVAWTFGMTSTEYEPQVET